MTRPKCCLKLLQQIIFCSLSSRQSVQDIRFNHGILTEFSHLPHHILLFGFVAISFIKHPVIAISNVSTGPKIEIDHHFSAAASGHYHWPGVFQCSSDILRSLSQSIIRWDNYHLYVHLMWNNAVDIHILSLFEASHPHPWRARDHAKVGIIFFGAPKTSLALSTVSSSICYQNSRNHCMFCRLCTDLYIAFDDQKIDIHHWHTNTATASDDGADNITCHILCACIVISFAWIECGCGTGYGRSWTKYHSANIDDNGCRKGFWQRFVAQQNQMLQKCTFSTMGINREIEYVVWLDFGFYCVAGLCWFCLFGRLDIFGNPCKIIHAICITWEKNYVYTYLGICIECDISFYVWFITFFLYEISLLLLFVDLEFSVIIYVIFLH